MPAVWAIVVAAGRGERFGGDAAGPAKQFLPLDDARVVDHAVRTATSACDAVVLVLAPGATWDGAPVAAVVDGGATRSQSVRRGLDAVPADAEVVVVHDAARPLATAALFDAVTAAVRAGADGAVPGVPVADTVKRVESGEVRGTVPRDDLVAVQTPQAFRAAALRDAHRAGGEGELPDATDDAALVEAGGGRVVVVAGEPHNRKITTADDLLVARALLHRVPGAEAS